MPCHCLLDTVVRSTFDGREASNLLASWGVAAHAPDDIAVHLPPDPRDLGAWAWALALDPREEIEPLTVQTVRAAHRALHRRHATS